MDHVFKGCSPSNNGQTVTPAIVQASGHKEYMFTTVDGSEIWRSPPGTFKTL